MIGVNRFAIKYSVVVVVIWTVTRCAQNLLSILVSKCGTIPEWCNADVMSARFLGRGVAYAMVLVLFLLFVRAKTGTVGYISYAWRSTGIALWRAID